MKILLLISNCTTKLMVVPRTHKILYPIHRGYYIVLYVPDNEVAVLSSFSVVDCRERRSASREYPPFTIIISPGFSVSLNPKSFSQGYCYAAAVQYIQHCKFQHCLRSRLYRYLFAISDNQTTFIKSNC